MNNVILRPVRVVSVSGGKDSLYMFLYCLSHFDKYPFDYVVHFELEIDFPFIKDVINLMEQRCKELGIKFLRIKPRKSWLELYNKYGYPNIRARWCNSHYKLDCQRQLNEWLKSFGCRPIMYIGFCYDENKRFKYELGNISDDNLYVYPLAEEHIIESDILSWAKNEPIFNDYYKYNKRCGCMGCPCSSLPNWAYLKKYYPLYFNYFIDKIKSYELKNSKQYFNVPLDAFIKKINDKYLDRVFYQYDIFDFME